MKLSESDLAALADLAVEAATTAGKMIAQTRPQTIDHKDNGGSLASQVVTEVDRRSEAIILQILTPTLERYDIGLLTEERPDDAGRFRADYFWCIDPIDGTLPFIEGTSGYAVSIALVCRDGRAVIGVVYDPVEETTIFAISGAGAFRDGESWKPHFTLEANGEATLSLFTDRSFLASETHDQVKTALQSIACEMGLAGVKIDASGGAVMNACRVLSTPPACYVKLPKQTGGGSLWDYAATACIFHEVGAIATDIDGHPFELNRGDSTLMCHKGIIFATSQSLAELLQNRFSCV